MNLFPYILGPVWVLDVTLTPDGHTIAAWRCKMGCEPQQTVYDAAAVAKGVAVVTVSGHGTIVKPADSQLAARVRDDRATFLWREHDGRIAFVRRERLQGVLTELSEAGIHPQRIEVSAPPDAAAAAAMPKTFLFIMLMRPFSSGHMPRFPFGGISIPPVQAHVIIQLYAPVKKADSNHRLYVF
mgnify:CR=1 FL=1